MGTGKVACRAQGCPGVPSVPDSWESPVHAVREEAKSALFLADSTGNICLHFTTSVERARWSHSHQATAPAATRHGPAPPQPTTAPGLMTSRARRGRQGP